MRRRDLLFSLATLGCGDDMRRPHTSERRQLGGSALLPLGPALASVGVDTPRTIIPGSLLRWIEVGAGSEVLSAPDATSPHGYATDLLDLSGNGYHLTAAAGQQAQYEPNGWNGRPSIAFDSIDDFYANTDVGTGAHAVALISGNDKSFMTFTVQQFFSTTVIQVVYSCGSTGGTTPFFDFGLFTTPSFFATKNFGGITKSIAGTPGDTLRHVLDLQCQGTQAQISAEGSVMTGGAYSAGNFDCGNAAVNRDCLGALARQANTISDFFFGRFVAQITVAGVPTAGEYSKLTAYLSKFTAPQTAPMLLIAGDSLSTVDKWNVDVAAGFPGATISNMALGGQTLTNWGNVNIARDSWSNFDPNRSVTLVSSQWCSNDIKNGVSGATCHTNLTNHISAIKAQHPAIKVFTATMGTRVGLTGPQETERQAFNTLQRNDHAGADDLLDRDQINPTLGDGTHPDANGNTMLYNGANGAQGIRAIMLTAGF